MNRAYQEGRAHGLNDLKKNQWGDPTAAYNAWIRWVKVRSLYESWMADKESYRQGYFSTKPLLSVTRGKVRNSKYTGYNGPR